MLYPGWTLNYEMYFYIVFAICLLFDRFRFIVMSMWFLITLFSLPWLLNLSGYKPAFIGGGYLNLMMQSLIFEFLFGVFCALIYKTGKFFIESKVWALICIGIAFVIPLSAYILGVKTQDHGPANFGMFLIPSFILITICGKYIENNISISRLLIHLGNISFSLYLSHVIVINVVYRIVSVFIDEAVGKGLVTFALTIPVAIVVASISYKYIECNLYAFLGKYKSPNKQVQVKSTT